MLIYSNKTASKIDDSTVTSTCASVSQTMETGALIVSNKIKSVPCHFVHNVNPNPRFVNRDTFPNTSNVSISTSRAIVIVQIVIIISKLNA